MDDCTLARLRTSPSIGRAGHGFPAHYFHEELIVFVFAQMLDCADGNARPKEELLLSASDPS
jgi:hypothetical protein